VPGAASISSIVTREAPSGIGSPERKPKVKTSLCGGETSSTTPPASMPLG
jgi:hypothetical protein